jgi:hypothetical protein
MAPGSQPNASSGQPSSSPGFAVPNYANPANAGAPYPQFGQPAPGFGPPAGPHGHSQPIALGTPSVMAAAAANGMPPPNSAQPGQGRTLLGAVAPTGLPNYSQGYPPYQGQGPSTAAHALAAQLPPGTQVPAHGVPTPPGTQPPPMGYGNPYPQAQGQPGYGPQGGMYQAGNPYLTPSAPGTPYAMSGGYHAAGPAVEPATAVPDARKRSSIARDVAIGVAIAALVLGGFLVVKFLILDGDGPAPEPAAAPSSIATIHLAMSPGISADLFVDDKKVATVSDKQEIPVTAGQRKVRLVGPGGTGCEQEMKLAAGKTTTLECAMAPPPPPPSPGSAAAADGPAAGSASAADSTGAAMAGSGSPAGSAAADGHGGVATTDKTDKADKSPPDDKPRAADRSHATDKPHPAAAAPADDDLGSLQGGTKPTARKADAPPVKPLAKQPVDSRSYLTVTSKPAAKILLDNADTGLVTPISAHALPVPAGKHKLTFVVGADKFTYSVVVRPGETVAIHKDLQ